ncbi:MAG: hypothetical protein HYZ07_02430, partial [Candidatus Harrisonbacteria bacterium]|nr:hypothetical protein [Candidatus Harrisonbacteria bacterium]
MPFLIPEQKRNIPWFGIAVFVLAMLAIVFGAYFLFFAPSPAIEVVVPAPLQNVNKISFIEVDPTTVVNSRAFRTLRSYTGLLGVGTLGRQNP